VRGSVRPPRCLLDRVNGVLLCKDVGETLLHRREETTSTVAFHIRPLYTAAVVDVIKHYKWQHVFYVFDDDDGKRRRFCSKKWCHVIALSGSPFQSYAASPAV